MAAAASRQQLLAELLEELITENNGQPVRISSGERTLGIFFPAFVSSRTSPPPITPEQRAELQRRLDTIDDAVSPEEMIAMIEEDLRSTPPGP